MNQFKDRVWLIGVGAGVMIWVYSVFATRDYVSTIHEDVKLIKECVIYKKC